MSAKSMVPWLLIVWFRSATRQSRREKIGIDPAEAGRLNPMEKPEQMYCSNQLISSHFSAVNGSYQPQ
jgi:hypothetical protein